MAAAKDVNKAVAFLQRFELGHQPPLWQMPTMLTAEELGVESDDSIARAPAHLFSHEAVVVYLVDQGDFFEVIDEHDMDATGVTFDQLHEIGVANLARMVPQLRIDDRSGVLTLQGLSMFEASMILCTPLWESDEFMTRYGSAGPIVAIPSRDTMAICARSNDDGLRRIRRAPVVWPSIDPELRLCRDLYARTPDGQWAPFESEHSRPDGTAEDRPPGRLPPGRLPAPAATEPSEPTDRPFTHLIAELSPEQRKPLNPTPSGEILDPVTPIETAGGTSFRVPSFAFSSLESVHYELLFASGYRFDSSTGEFVRSFVGEPGAPPDPWTLPDWGAGERVSPPADRKTRRFFRRS